VQLKPFDAKNVLVYIGTYCSEFSPLPLYRINWAAERITRGYKNMQTLTLRVMPNVILAAFGEIALLLLRCLGLVCISPSKTILSEQMLVGCGETILSKHYCCDFRLK
jgi:hypothetical protein